MLKTTTSKKFPKYGKFIRVENNKIYMSYTDINNELIEQPREIKLESIKEEEILDFIKKVLSQKETV